MFDMSYSDNAFGLCSTIFGGIYFDNAKISKYFVEHSSSRTYSLFRPVAITLFKMNCQNNSSQTSHCASM